MYERVIFGRLFGHLSNPTTSPCSETMVTITGAYRFGLCLILRHVVSEAGQRLTVHIFTAQKKRAENEKKKTRASCQLGLRRKMVKMPT